MGPVVVGIDGSEAAADALLAAIGEARLRGTSVVAVHVWDVPVGDFLDGYAPTGDAIAACAESARELVENAVAGIEGVETVLRESHAVGETLVEEAAERDAALLVVGSRGLGAVRGLVLGSVSGYCSRHARCPVLVVHHAPAPASP